MFLITSIWCEDELKSEQNNIIENCTKDGNNEEKEYTFELDTGTLVR